MSELSDRLIATLIAGTAAAGLLAWVFGGYVRAMVGDRLGFELWVVYGVVLVVILFGIWEGFDRMD